MIINFVTIFFSDINLKVPKQKKIIKKNKKNNFFYNGASLPQSSHMF